MFWNVILEKSTNLIGNFGCFLCDLWLASSYCIIIACRPFNNACAKYPTKFSINFDRTFSYNNSVAITIG